MFRGLISLYSPSYPTKLVALYAVAHERPLSYFARYWSTSNFATVKASATTFSRTQRLTARLTGIGMAVQAAAGAFVAGLDVFGGLSGGWQFGLAVLLSTPLVWAHLLPLTRIAVLLTRPKALGRAVLCAVLEAQVRRLRRRHAFKVVAVAGSVGKTSTKIAVARVLQAAMRVRSQEGNYNDRVTVPLIFFDRIEPGIFNIPAWLRIMLQNERTIRGSYPYDVVVVELGTDGPGFMREFAYVQPDVSIVTAITPEHMEYFGTLDAVAREELTVLDYSATTLINIDDTPAAYLKGKSYQSYGLSKRATYRVASRTQQGFAGQKMELALGDDQLAVAVPLLGEQGAKVALAALAAAHALQLSHKDIVAGAARIEAFAGRMQILPGIRRSVLIDDTYNASPVAVTAALDVLYAAQAPQRIAILGSMNELGDYSPEAHQIVGNYCDPKKLDVIIALGPDAVTYLAPAAEARGCKVEKFLDPYEAGAFVVQQLKEHAVVLAKGSQNRVFAEEALKTLLAHKVDENKLVRQSAYWMRIKAAQFPKA
jgi:UDP-N-acetylmuramoyl-tripeptide--D-alanyl-D-alanine ligase